MTMYTVVSVFDSAVQAYGRPMYVPALGAAMRSFQDEVNREAEDNPMWRHADDYSLYSLGYFNDATGIFDGHAEGPSVVMRAKDCRK